jgi:hypothetical protein
LEAGLRAATGPQHGDIDDEPESWTSLVSVSFWANWIGANEYEPDLHSANRFLATLLPKANRMSSIDFTLVKL